MTAVFSHGRLRLYLLKLLAEGPKHGYELIRLLENRFHGLYAPSAGTIYPRLQRLEAEGLVTHAAAGGRKVYEISPAGRAELTQRATELAELERDIRDSVADLSSLATEIEQQVTGSARDIRRELSEAARQTRTRPSRDRPWAPGFAAGTGAGPEVAAERAGAELERAVGTLTAEVRRLARRPGLRDSDLRAAVAVITAASAEIRRLLRG
jgi:DNA-binding PadR family transcriptional regulator